METRSCLFGGERQDLRLGTTHADALLHLLRRVGPPVAEEVPGERQPRQLHAGTGER